MEKIINWINQGNEVKAILIIVVAGILTLRIANGL